MSETNTQINVRIRNKYDTESNWTTTAASYVPPAGELIISAPGATVNGTTCLYPVIRVGNDSDPIKMLKVLNPPINWESSNDVGAFDRIINRPALKNTSDQKVEITATNGLTVPQGGISTNGMIRANNIDINGLAGIDSDGIFHCEEADLGTTHVSSHMSVDDELFCGKIITGQATGETLEDDIRVNLDNKLIVYNDNIHVLENIVIEDTGIYIGPDDDMFLGYSAGHAYMIVTGEHSHLHVSGDRIYLQPHGKGEAVTITGEGNITCVGEITAENIAATSNIRAEGVISTNDSIETPAVYVTDQLHVGSVTEDYLFNVADKLTIGADDSFINVNGISIGHTDHTYDLTLGDNDEFRVNRDETDNTTYVSIVDNLGQMILRGDQLSVYSREENNTVTLTYEHIKKLIALSADSEKLIALAQLASVTEQT